MPERGLGDAPVDPLQAQDRVLDDRQERVDHQRRQRRGLADLAPEERSGGRPAAPGSGSVCKTLARPSDRPLGTASTGSPAIPSGTPISDGDQDRLADQVEVRGGRLDERPRAGLAAVRASRSTTPPPRRSASTARRPGRRSGRTRWPAAPGSRPASPTWISSPRSTRARRSADPAGLAEVVGDEDHRLAQVALERPELVLDLAAGDRVEGAERLVHQDQVGVGRQGPGHADPLPLAAAELVREPTRRSICGSSPTSSRQRSRDSVALALGRPP